MEGNKIYNALFSSQKVELKSIKEVKQAISILKENIKESEKEGNEYAKAEAELIKAWSKLNNHRNAIYSNAFRYAPSVIEDIKSAAKELGIDASNIPEIKELEKLIDSVKEYVKFFDKIDRPKEQI